MYLPRLAAALCFLSAALHADGLSKAGPVYLAPMDAALDQYLAEAIADEGVLSVTVDPKLARTVMTDRIDARFLEALDEWFPREEDKKTEEEEEGAEGGIGGEIDFQRPVNRPRGRPRGAVFLVDVASREVVWSTFHKPYETRPKKLHRKARNIVSRLKKDVQSAGS